MTQVQTIKKLSPATVYGKISPTKLVNAADGRLPVMRALGMAVGSKEGLSTIGGEERKWTGLIGTFECTNLETGEVFRGSTLFLPEVALTPILVGMAQQGSRGATFAIDLTAVLVPDEKRRPGGSFYEYQITNLAPDAEDDPIALLKASMDAQARKALTDESNKSNAEANAAKMARKGRK
jgi:hypothetical protein